MPRLAAPLYADCVIGHRFSSPQRHPVSNDCRIRRINPVSPTGLGHRTKKRIVR